MKTRPLIDASTFLVLLLTIAGAIKVYISGGMPALTHILVEDLGFFGTIFLKVMAGCLIAAFLIILLPKEVITRWIGAEAGFKGLCVGLFIGAFFPSGPFNIFPLAIAMRLAGAGTGATIAFITSWALIGLNRAIIWEMPFLGADFVLPRLLVSLPAPIIAGYIAQKIEGYFQK
jgi:uncharacterized membrane protein YraQ (UPF0718 family)